MKMHEAVLARFQRALADGHVPHAWLLAGPRGVGKREILARMAQMALCEARRGCGSCRPCRLFLAGTHPDAVRLEREPGERDLRVDRVREGLSRLFLTSAEGGMRVLLLPEAEAMNLQAANALLKTLEEPSGHALMLLATTDPMQLPATVRSRCVLVRVGTLPETEAMAVLEGQGVAPAQARNWLAWVPGRPWLAREASGWEEPLAAWARLCADPLQASPAEAEDWCRRYAARVPAPFVAFAAVRSWLEREQLSPAVGAALWSLARWPEEMRRFSLRPALSLFARWLALREAAHRRQSP